MTAPRFSEQPFPVRRVGPRAADGSAPGEGYSSRPSPGAAYIGLDLGSGDYSAISLVFSGAVMLSLRLSAAEAGLSEEQLISKLVAQHAAKIGIARLSEFQQGGEAVSRVAHNHDVAGSNPAPATTSVIKHSKSKFSQILRPPEGGLFHFGASRTSAVRVVPKPCALNGRPR